MSTESRKRDELMMATLTSIDANLQRLVELVEKRGKASSTTKPFVEWPTRTALKPPCIGCERYVKCSKMEFGFGVICSLRIEWQQSLNL